MTAIPNPLGDFAGDLAGVAPVPSADPSLVVARLNGLLRGEIAAAETYGNVLERLTAEGHDGDVESLREMQAEHGRSCHLLRGRIEDLGGTAVDGSGVWGIWAQTVQGTLSLFGGDVGSLRALHEGEEHGQRDYESALNEVDAVTAQLIQDRLLPAQAKHVAALERMLASKDGR